MAWSHSRFGARKVCLAWLLASIAACVTSRSSPSPGSGSDAGGVIDANGPAGVDAGALPTEDAASTCSPANVQGYSPRWTPPTAHSSSCTADQITSYATCLASGDPTSAACTAWLGLDASPANADCHACMNDSSSTDPSWGPVVDTGSIRQINIAGCMALVSGDTGGTGCAGQYQALEGCESAACATNCANVSTTQLASCVSTADNVGCSNYSSAAECVNDAGAADECFGGGSSSFAVLFDAVATVFCLSTGDAGAGDAGDAGDGG